MFLSFGSFAKYEVFLLFHLPLAGLLCLFLNVAALGESDRWSRCRSAADPDARMGGCTEVIGQGNRGSRRDRTEAYVNRSAAYRAKGDLDRAIADLDKALKLDPRSSPALIERASIRHSKGEFDRAIADYDKALQLDENSATAHGGRAKAYRSKGDLDRALADLDMASTLDPNSAALYLERAALRRARGDLDRAVADYDRAIELDPRSAAAFLDRAGAYREKHDLEHARRDLETASTLDPRLAAAREALDELNRIESAAPPSSAPPTTIATKDSAHAKEASGAHGLPLITTLATALGLALLLGFLAARIKLPALVGYLLAGVFLGPFTPGFVANTEIAGELAEIGVMLLMFGVGLHFSLDDLLDVRKIALPGAVLQIAVATALGAGVASLWGWGTGGSLVFGLALSVASTVVLLRALEARGALESMNGRIAVGWLVVEDLAMVLVLVLLPPMGEWLGGSAPAGRDGTLLLALGVTLLKVSAFIALMLVVGRQVFPQLLWQVARTGSRELFTLCIVAAAVSIAFAAAKLFGVSFALGAFFAGMVLRESEFGHRAAEESLPLRDAFAVLFFVSVGMLFDPMVLVEQPLRGLAVVGIIVVGKSIAAAILVLVLGYPLNTALTVSASLAQIGEFSFILAGLGVSLGLLPPEGRSLILAGALISIAINPLVFASVEPLRIWMRSRSALARNLERPADPLAELPMTTDEKYLSGQVVLVGYGRVGRRIGESLADQGVPYVVAEQNRELVERLRQDGLAAVSGDASDPAVLVQAHIAHASMLVVATPDTFNVRQMLKTARTLNPEIETVVRTHNEEEAMLLEREAASKVFFVEEELAKGMGHHVLKRYGKAPREARA
ncbi:MAG: Kef family K(+) transporter [Methylocystaceae bacterium]|nr:MAG: Kef family K(+) transporter [Methylocystaceae bacterium]